MLLFDAGTGEARDRPRWGLCTSEAGANGGGVCITCGGGGGICW